MTETGRRSALKTGRTPTDSLTPGAQLPNPKYRASILKSQFEGVKKTLSTEHAAAVFAELPHEFIQEVNDAVAPEWIGLPDGDIVARAVHTVLGTDGAVAFWRQQTVRFAKIKIFRSFVKTLLRLFTTPEGLLKAVIHASNLVSRDMGNHRIVSERDDTQALFIVTEIPRTQRSEAKIAAWEGTILGTFDLLGATGSVESDARRLPNGELRINVHWSNH